MVLVDLFDYLIRNTKKMKTYELKKLKKDLLAIVSVINREIERANKSA